jgi:hypothetical protein
LRALPGESITKEENALACLPFIIIVALEKLDRVFVFSKLL